MALIYKNAYIVYTPELGLLLSAAKRMAAELALESRMIVRFEFNGKKYKCCPAPTIEEETDGAT